MEEQFQYEEKETKKKKWLLLLMLLVLILFSVTTFYIGYKLGKRNYVTPTGNIDIFDINISTSKPVESNNSPDIESSPDYSGDLNQDSNVDSGLEDDIGDSNNSTPSTGDEEDQDDGKVTVLDNDITWSSKNVIKIFSNPVYAMNNMIAPGSTNSYQFIMRNNNDFGIIYALKMVEENEHDINMKFRLKQDGKYVIGDENTWGDANQLIFTDIILAIKSKNIYTLEWKWFENGNDTYLGENAESINYKLTININAEQY